MTGGEEEPKKGEGKGFAGLSSLVSHVDTSPPPPVPKKEPAAAAPSAGRPGLQAAQPQPSQQRQTYQEPTQPPSGDSLGGKWLLGIVVVFGVLFWLLGLSNKNEDSSSLTNATTIQAQKNSQGGTPNKTEKSLAPKFGDYSSEIYSGQRAKVNLLTDFDKNFKTRIRKTHAESINFAGEYILATWGCGMDCLMGVAVSARTGQVIELPGTACCWKSAGEKIIFKKNSRLLVLAGLINETGQHGAHFYELKNNEFFYVKTIPVKEDEPSDNSATLAPAPSNQNAASAYSPTPILPQQSTSPTEEKPPIGSSLVLSNEQIRYCLAEDIRMEAAKAVVNSYNDGDVDRFNALVVDYNSRCESFRYRSGALESARRDIEPYRSQLQSEGQSRSERPSTGSLSTPAPARPAPDATVQAIQRNLNELGYDAGTADGLMGRGTRSAIIAFQQDRGLAASGVAHQALLLQLQGAPALTSPSPAESRPATASVQLSSAEAASLEAACSTDKYVNGPAAYRACAERQKTALAAGVRRPSLSALSSAEQQSIEAACSTDKYVNGPAAYNQCLSRQLAAMSGQGIRRPDLSRLSNSERQSIEAACSTDKYVNGPAAYNRCLNTQLAALDQQGDGPDLSRLSTADRRSIESACSTDKYVNGPAAYNRCLSKQLARLR